MNERDHGNRTNGFMGGSGADVNQAGGCSLDRLELFFGEAHPALARIYARLPIADSDEGYSLTGTVTGPYCHYAKTLPATMPLRQTTPDRPLLAEAVAPDPGFWTPDLPNTYRVEVSLVRGGETIATHRWDWGIRPLAARGRRLVYLGRNWTLRAAYAGQLGGAEQLETWRAAEMACIMPPPTDEACEFASRRGVLLVVDFADREPTLDELYRYGRWPAVGLCVFDSDWNYRDEFRAAARNVIFAARLTVGFDKPPPAWAQAVVCDADDSDLLQRLQDKPLAVIGSRVAGQTDRSLARRACDALQRDLAARADVAGYIV